MISTHRFIWVGLALFSAALSALGQVNLTVNGVADRSIYTDTVTFSVPSTAGYTYQVLLDGKQVATDANQMVDFVDYHELLVSRTNLSTFVVSNRLVRFIVQSSNRTKPDASPELGLVEWTPYPPIPSTAAEFAGAQLHLVTPQQYPQGLEIPVAAWVDDGAGKERRANGWVSAPGFESSAFRILRGHGHGFLPAQTSSGTVTYNGQLSALSSTKQVQIESSTTWSNVSGTLSGSVDWPANSRIYITGSIVVAGSTSLTIGQGTIIKLNPLVNITVTNRGKVTINGTINQPVVLTATNRVAPEKPAGAWGGFIIRDHSELVANGAIMTGGGGATSFSFSPGSSHKPAQALLLVHSNSVASLTNCYLINQAGQIANGYNSDITYDHCLLQRAITSGESEGGTVIVNHSAIIEFPSVDGVESPAISDGDYDAIYFTTGTHIIQNSLIGFAKDDAIDSGSGGAGTVVVSNCWIEAALHEALAWSGGGRQTWTYDTVAINCGQGLECGWSTGTNSPLCYAERLLSTANSIGTRYGDNYTGTGGLGLKSGHLTPTNCFFIYNHRDVFGRPWDDTWNWRTNDMNIVSNFLTAPSPFCPSNTVWNPAVDAPRLLPFMPTPVGAPVGIGVATWDPALPLKAATEGVPVRLSTFTTNSVSVAFTVETSSQTVTNGTLVFNPGETLKKIVLSSNVLTGQVLKVTLNNPVNGELTGTQYTYVLPVSAAPAVPAVSVLPRGSTWSYNDKGTDLGTAWRAPAYDDSTWSSGPAELGFGDNDEATKVNGGPATAVYPTIYFRKAFQVSDPAAFGNLSMWMLRDDGGVVYLNGTEVYRSASMPAGTISYGTYATAQGSAPPDNTVDTATLSTSPLVNGRNVVAVEIHQFNATSSDLSFNFELLGNPVQPPPTLSSARFANELALFWSSPGSTLEEADSVAGPWRPATSYNGGAIVPIATGQKFYRLH